MEQLTNNLSALKGCILGGAIGDCFGFSYENNPSKLNDVSLNTSNWQMTDDTQLTLATLESIITNKKVIPADLADTFKNWYNNRQISGLGSSTLKALQELQFGGHWAMVGRRGEYAAGNGAAMRIAPLAFILNPEDFYDRVTIHDTCIITHNNEEAYCGALAVVLAIYYFLNDMPKTAHEFIHYIIQHLPDSNTRDRLCEMLVLLNSGIYTIANKFGCSGFVAESVPLAIFAASKIFTSDFKEILIELIQCGGDTDTNASIFGQITGTYLNSSQLPNDFLEKLSKIRQYDLIRRAFNQLDSLR